MEVPTVRDCMNTKLVTLSPGMRIQAAIKVLLKHRISGAPVVDQDGKLVGVLSEKDCLRIFANGAYNVLPGSVVERYMSKSVMTIDVEADLFTVADTFIKNPFRRLPIVDEAGVLIGQISRRDVLNGSHRIWSESPIKKEWTDAKYLTDEIKAALSTPPKNT